MGGDTGGTYSESKITRLAAEILIERCEWLIELHRRLAESAVRTLRKFVDDISLPYSEPAKEWVTEQVDAIEKYLMEKVMPPLEKGIRTLCAFIVSDVLPWIMATQTIRDTAAHWAVEGEMAHELAGMLHGHTVESQGFAIGSWSGLGKDSYIQTIRDQHEYAVALAAVPEGIGKSLFSVAQQLEDSALGLSISVTGICATIAGVVVAIETAGPTLGIGAVVGVIIAVIGLIMTLIGQVVGAAMGVKTLLDGATEQIGQLDTVLNSLAIKSRGSWPFPGVEISGRGGMGGTPSTPAEYDDGSGRTINSGSTDKRDPLWDDGIE